MILHVIMVFPQGGYVVVEGTLYTYIYMEIFVTEIEKNNN